MKPLDALAQTAHFALQISSSINVHYAVLRKFLISQVQSFPVASQRSFCLYQYRGRFSYLVSMPMNSLGQMEQRCQIPWQAQKKTKNSMAHSHKTLAGSNNLASIGTFWGVYDFPFMSLPRNWQFLVYPTLQNTGRLKKTKFNTQ